MKQKRNHFFAGLAVAALAIGGIVFVDAKTTRPDLSEVQLATIESLSSDNESSVKIPCRTYYGKTCKFNAINAEGQYGTVVLNDQERVN